MCIIPGYTLGMKNRVGVGNCTVGFISHLCMAYPSAQVGLLSTLVSPAGVVLMSFLLVYCREG
jgi:hypothetical protein